MSSFAFSPPHVFSPTSYQVLDSLLARNLCKRKQVDVLSDHNNTANSSLPGSFINKTNATSHCPNCICVNDAYRRLYNGCLSNIDNGNTTRSLIYSVVTSNRNVARKSATQASRFVNPELYDLSLREIEDWSFNPPGYDSFKAREINPSSAIVKTVCSSRKDPLADKKLKMDAQVILHDYISVLGIECSLDYASVFRCRGFGLDEVNLAYIKRFDAIVNSFGSSIRYLKIRNRKSLVKLQRIKKKKRTNRINMLRKCRDFLQHPLVEKMRDKRVYLKKTAPLRNTAIVAREKCMAILHDHKYAASPFVRSSNFQSSLVDKQNQLKFKKTIAACYVPLVTITNR